MEQLAGIQWNSPSRFLLNTGCSRSHTLCRLESPCRTPFGRRRSNQFIDVDVRPTKSTYSDEEIWQLLSALSGASNATQFQALPRPQQKLHLFAAHEEGIGPRTLSRLTGVPYSIVQRATSDTVRYGSMVCESLPGDEEYETYIDDTEYEKYPEY